MNDLQRNDLMADPVRYSDYVTIRCTPEVTALIEEAARRRGMKPSEYRRQALLTGLRLDGFDPTHNPTPESNAVLEGS
jgi:hypothetical protein